jgi:hypothetical protein
MDEVKIIELSNFKSIPSYPQTETSGRTLSDPARYCPVLLESLQNSNTFIESP